MPQPVASFAERPSAEDLFLQVLLETLEGVDEPTRAKFFQRFIWSISQVDLTEAQSLQVWSELLRRRDEVVEPQGHRTPLKTLLLEVIASAGQMRFPILIEYEEFRKLRINAATDALTGLYNRRLFDEYLDRELNRVRRYGQQLAVVILDLHRLKEVNDRHGHLRGDQVLQLAASTLRKTLRASDSAFRIGGDEFALLLPETDPEQASTLCRRIRGLYESETRPLHLEIPITLDYGIAVHPDDGESRDALLRLADERLYQLKHSGRAPSRVIPIEPETREPQPASRESGAPEVQAPSTQPSTSVPAAKGAERRKWERVSLAGTRASAVLSDAAQQSASVVDLSYGGVALLVENADELPNQFHATLHVPILPPVRVTVRRTYTLKTEGALARVGCEFVS